MRTTEPLVWNVLNLSTDGTYIRQYNIFYDGFAEEVKKEIKRRKITNRDDFKKYIDTWAHYYYWSKTECEMLIGDLFSKSVDDFHKVDLYAQIVINLDKIVDYIINKLKIDFKQK